MNKALFTQRTSQRDVSRQIERMLERLSQPISDRLQTGERLHELRQLLGCVLLGTADYDVALARIGNAQRYLGSDEKGAARYELRLLVAGLRAQLSDVLGMRPAPPVPARSPSERRAG